MNQPYANELQAVMLGMVFKKDRVIEYTPTQIIEVVAKALWLLPEDLKRKVRDRTIVDARYLAITLIKQRCGLTVKKIGALFNIDHSTVTYAVQTSQDLLETNAAFNAKHLRVLSKMEEAI